MKIKLVAVVLCLLLSVSSLACQGMVFGVEILMAGAFPI